MTIDQIIALLSSAGACGAAVAALLTTWQVAKQRRASYRPELALSTTRFEASGATVGQPILPLHWIRQAAVSVKEEKFFAMPLNNIGLGSAKEVKITWSFDIPDLIDEINAGFQRALIPAHFIFEGEMLTLRSQSLGQKTSLWRNQRNAHTDYILPAAVQPEPYMLTVPDAYQLLVAGRLFVWAQFPEHREAELEIPVLHLLIEYLDIGNAKHSAQFDIRCDLLMIRGPGEAFEGYLASKRIG
jgi:hypothetical protein